MVTKFSLDLFMQARAVLVTTGPRGTTQKVQSWWTLSWM